MFKQKPRILKNFFRVQVDAPLSSADIKFLLHQKREAKLVIASFLSASIAVHSKSKWVCKGDC